MEKFQLNRRDAKLMGVGAGIADATGVDPLIVRLGLVLAVLVTGPIAVILYLVAAWLASRPLRRATARFGHCLG